MIDAPTLHAVHCVDTEGPLEEPLDATFDRLTAQFGIQLEPSRETLRALQRSQIPLAGREADVARWLAPARLNYLSTWADVEHMAEVVTSRPYRDEHRDPAGNPYCFSWFIIDVVGYRDNPRRKAAGFHAVWDVYERLLRDTRSLDAVGWHFHTVPVGGHALEYNSCWTNNDFHEQSMARRLLQRQAFPSIFRAGGVIERLDVSFWLEQFIPFDFSSGVSSGRGQPGAISDWRHAPLDWSGYHPSHDDYRRPGRMRRWIFRCLEVSGYETVIDPAEVEEAFRQVRSGMPALLAYSSHDRRDLRPDVEQAERVIRDVASGYPDVPWRWSNAIDASRAVTGIAQTGVPTFSHEWKGDVLFIRTNAQLFGPAPFLAVEEVGDVFFRDNPTVEGPAEWAYRLVRRSRTIRIGVGGSTASGATAVHIIPLSERRS